MPTREYLNTELSHRCFLQLITDLRPPIPICEGWKLMVGEFTYFITKLLGSPDTISLLGLKRERSVGIMKGIFLGVCLSLRDE